ncbi:hypothetical protein ALC62_00730 [Cyphomyrmex costatus]|uniref:Uncharacterized protein n=1 Tax=Cyphomyrmex costatus TaxID=456900 RepID=A0A151IQA1_9HYME|nr:hypothetical protein ALC62_00730 [Cyphomyrmex costatus]
MRTRRNRREKEEVDEDAGALDRLPPVYRAEKGQDGVEILGPTTCRRDRLKCLRYDIKPISNRRSNDNLFLVKCQSQQSLIKQLHAVAMTWPCKRKFSNSIGSNWCT